ncbi:hypothetical protein SORBI_3009G248200 [Sorghum bicolor]|uniref:Uncharacterized protein n=1 Tax=Sorghum bicolor TaxID=4558 RepID=A0A1B6PB33_SORBI|nr:hypothetical protein SORBI_3009G248200 [Sorghum bicolor]
MFTFYLWFVFAEHPFFFHRRTICLFFCPAARFALDYFPTRDLGMRRSPPCGTIQFNPSETTRRRVPAIALCRILCETGARLQHSPSSDKKIRSFCREDPSREARRVSASLTLIIFAE